MVNRRSLLVIDSETSGLDLTKCEVASIGAIVLDKDTLEELDSYYSELKPDLPFNPEIHGQAYSVNGLSREQLEKARPQKVVWKEFADWVLSFNPEKNQYTNVIPCGHNVKFDLNFIEQALNKYKIAKYDDLFSKITLDTYGIAFLLWHKNPQLVNFKLTEIADAMQIKLDKAHNAKEDAQATTQILKAFLTYFRNVPITDFIDKSKLVNINTKKPERQCPKCGRAMSIRRRKSDGAKFLGCSGYFETENQCKHIINISDERQ